MVLTALEKDGEVQHSGDVPSNEVPEAWCPRKGLPEPGEEVEVLFGEEGSWFAVVGGGRAGVMRARTKEKFKLGARRDEKSRKRIRKSQSSHNY